MMSALTGGRAEPARYIYIYSIESEEKLYTRNRGELLRERENSSVHRNRTDMYAHTHIIYVVLRIYTIEHKSTDGLSER